MLSIEEIGEFIDDLDENTVSHFSKMKSENWEVWESLPQTKMFLEFVILKRLKAVIQITYVNGRDVNVAASELAGQQAAYGEVIRILGDIKFYQDEEKRRNEEEDTIETSN